MGLNNQILSLYFLFSEQVPEKNNIVTTKSPSFNGICQKLNVGWQTRMIFLPPFPYNDMEFYVHVRKEAKRGTYMVQNSISSALDNAEINAITNQCYHQC